MSDSSEPNMAFEPEEGAPEIDFQILDEGESAPEAPKADPGPPKVTLTPEEHAALLAKGNETATLSQGLASLAESLRTPAPAQPMNLPQPQEQSDEDFEKELFAPGKGKQVIQRMLQQQQMQMQAQNISLQIDTNKKLLKLDPKTATYFNKYEGEIERRVQSLPPQVRFRADIYEAVYKEVLIEKQEEIIQDRVQSSVDAAVAKALEAAGIKTPSKEPGAPALRMAGSGVTPTPAAKKTVYLTKDQVEDMKSRMMDPKDPDQLRIYYERFGKKGK